MYKIRDRVLNKKVQIKDLRVANSRNFLFNDHVENIINKVNANELFKIH